MVVYYIGTGIFLKIYNSMSKQPGADGSVLVNLACACFCLGMYKEADAACSKGTFFCFY